MQKCVTCGYYRCRCPGAGWVSIEKPLPPTPAQLVEAGGASMLLDAPPLEIEPVRLGRLRVSFHEYGRRPHAWRSKASRRNLWADSNRRQQLIGQVLWRD